MSDGIAELHDGDTLVASVRPIDLDLDPPAAATGRGRRGGGAVRPVLRPRRPPVPDLLRVRTAVATRATGCGSSRARSTTLFAAAWTPPAEFADESGRLPDELVWAALDCPTSAPVANDPAADDYLPIVLARFAARIDGPVVAGEPHVIVTWPIAVDGRKREAGAAIYSRRAASCAASREALWIELRAA